MYIFMYDLYNCNPRFVKKKLYGFYSDVLSDLNPDSMTKKEIVRELEKREVGKAIKGRTMILIFKKF